MISDLVFLKKKKIYLSIVRRQSSMRGQHKNICRSCIMKKIFVYIPRGLHNIFSCIRQRTTGVGNCVVTSVMYASVLGESAIFGSPIRLAIHFCISRVAISVFKFDVGIGDADFLKSQ